MRTILVTGGAGFIGGTFVRRLVAEQTCRVINLDLLTYAGNLDSLAPIAGADNHVFVKGDIADRQLVAQLFRDHRPSAIVHFAAESHVDRSIGTPSAFVATNVVGTQNLLECVREYLSGLSQADQQAFRFLHISTDEVYGSLGAEGRFAEANAYAPNSPYSASKAAADHLVRAYFRTYGLPVLTSVCSNNYGPYQFPEKLVPLMILNAIERKPLPVYGTGSNIRDWLHVDDHCDALLRILEQGRPGQVYNVGGDTELTNLEVVAAICESVDQLCPDPSGRPSRQLITHVADRPGHDFRYAIDASKLRNELGWRPKHDFNTGIQQTVEWYRNHQAWTDRVTTGSYQRQRLGLLPAATTSSGDRQSADVSTVRSEPVRSKPIEFVDGPIDGVDFFEPPRHCDERGWLIELFRHDELPSENYPMMAYVSETNPGAVRGPHEHVEQTDFFAFVGPGNFEMRLWDARPNSPTFGHRIFRLVGVDHPSCVLVPPGVVHSYRNTGSTVGWVFNAPNRLYAGHGKRQAVDEIRHEADHHSPFEA